MIRVLQVATVALATTVPLLEPALDGIASGSSWVAAIALWTIWAGMFLCILVPSSSTLTAIRLLAPTHLGILLAVVIGAGDIEPVWRALVAIGSSALVVVASMSGDVGRHFVQLSAYGDERRFLLSCPPQFVATQIVMWMLWFATALAAVISLTGAESTAGRVIVGSITGTIAISGVVFLPPRFHRFSRRWLVSVPAGVVLHDHVVLAETAMVSDRAVTSVDVWRPGQQPEPLNLTGGRARFGLMVAMREPETIILSPDRDHPGGRALHVHSFLVRPTRLTPALDTLTGRRSGA